MPNYTKNTLIIRGNKDLLRYFYEQNRVTEDDEKYLSDIHGKKKDLSFSKSVSVETGEFMLQFIMSQNNIKLNNYFDSAVVMWGTKWNAGDPVVDLKNIENGEITYTFDTAWCYPQQWLEQVSIIYKNLEFYINFTNEDDNYDETFEYKYKDGKFEELKRYSYHLQQIDKLGGIEKVVNDIIEYFENNPNEVYSSNSDDIKKDYFTTIVYMIEKEKSKNIISYMSGSNDNFSDFLQKYTKEEYYGFLNHDKIQECLIEKIKLLNNSSLINQKKIY